MEIFGEGPTEVSEGAFTDTKRDSFTSEDVRFITKNGILYAIVLKFPENRIVNIKSLGKGSEYSPERVNSIKLLGDNGKIQWNWTEEGLLINIAECDYRESPIVFAIK